MLVVLQTVKIMILLFNIRFHDDRKKCIEL